jgi:hypothetical protein
VDEAEISASVARLARPHASGGVVIERAAILAEGANFAAVMEWISAHGGKPEMMSPAPRRGLHGGRLNDSGGTGSPQTPLRFVLPAEALLSQPRRETAQSAASSSSATLSTARAPR